MKKINHILMGVLLIASAVVCSCNSNDTNEKKNYPSKAVNLKNDAAKDNITDASSWPERPRYAVTAMTAKYGAPTESGSESMVWYNVGPYKRILVTKIEAPHDFPLPHMDFLEHTIPYNVPIDKIDDLIAFDASITVNKTQGEMSARCDLEGHNVLTLNLANDIVKGSKTVEQARAYFAEMVKADNMGKHPAYVEQLQFTPSKDNVAFLDKSNIPGAPMRNLPNTEGTDAEVLAFLAAVDVNEIVAASEAQRKKISEPVMNYAKMLHMQHGDHMGKTLMLGQSIKITPSDTKAVDAVKVKGAGELAMLMPLDGKDFEMAYVDAMIKGHTEVLDMIDNKLMKNAKNDMLKTHLTETRKHIAMHLEEGKKLKENK